MKVWKRDKIHHDTCVHQVRQNDGSWKECGITITEGQQHRWLCPMHDRIVFLNAERLRNEQLLCML